MIPGADAANIELAEVFGFRLKHVGPAPVLADIALAIFDGATFPELVNPAQAKPFARLEATDETLEAADAQLLYEEYAPE